MNVFLLNQQIQNALNQAINESGEIVDENALMLWENGIQTKNEILLNLACEVKNLEAESEALKSTISNLTERKRIAQNKIERIQKFIKMQLQTGEKLSDGRVKIGWRKSEELVFKEDAPDPQDVNIELVKITYEFSKTAIKDAIKAGQEISWASIESKENLQIK